MADDTTSQMAVKDIITTVVTPKLIVVGEILTFEKSRLKWSSLSQP
ncbi:MAG: hypothetical protein RLZZ141_841 [Pseudomonadota bacterium]